MTIKKNQIEDYISDTTQTALDGKVSTTWAETINWVKTFDDGIIASSANILGGWIDNTVIGSVVPAAGNFTTVNGVALTTWGVSTNFLDEQGNYTAPPSWAVDSVNSKTWVVILDKTDIWLSNVDNTSDATKEVATTNALKSATTDINVSSATAPTVGQILTATSPTAATWQDAAWGGWGMTLLSTIDVTSPITQIDTTSSVFDGTYDWYIIKGYLEADMNWRVFVNFSNNDLSSMLTIWSMHFVAKSTSTTQATSLNNTIWIVNQENTSFSSEPWVWFEMKMNSTVEALRVMWGSSYVDAWFSKVVLDNFTMKATAWNSMRLYPSAWNFDAWFVSIYWITT